MNATVETYNRRPRALAHADRLAEAVALDMVAAGWVPTVVTFLGRVTKARIVEAVREGRGEQAASSIAGLKKGAMAEEAEALLTGSGWLPEPLRTLGRRVGHDHSERPVTTSALTPDDEATPGDGDHDKVDPSPYPIAAE